jgi:hypothetical protein
MRRKKLNEGTQASMLACVSLFHFFLLTVFIPHLIGLTIAWGPP